MAFPFENLATLGWVPSKGIPGVVTRPVSGAESVLDQVRRLNAGMNDIVGCVQFSHTLPLALLEERIQEVWLRLRFHSPLVAADIIHDANPEILGYWAYKSVDLEGAKEWRQSTLHFCKLPKGHLTKDLIDEFIQEKLAVPLPHGGDTGLLFHGYVLFENETNRAAMFLHATHVILDGPALIDCFDLLLEGITQPSKSEHSTKMPWGTEVNHLPPHPVELFGGTLDGWETDGIELLKDMDRVFEDERISHNIRPQRTLVEKPGHTRKVCHAFTKEETSQIIARVKTLQSTITVMLEAAHVLATLSLQPPPSLNGRTVLFPSIVALRHLMKPPWNRRETLVVTGAAVPIVALHSIVQSDSMSMTEREKMITLMKDFRLQYIKWLSSSHHIFITPAQAAMDPIRNAINDADAEITGLGILERKLGVVWEGAIAGERLVVDDFHLGLRRTAPVLMTHSWTFGGSLRLQCQGNDMWDLEFMQQFLDEMVRYVRTLLG